MSNRKYIDFVPKGVAKKPAVERSAVKTVAVHSAASKPATRPAVKSVAKPATKPVMEPMSTEKSAVAVKPAPKMEDYRKKFVNTARVTKRPLSKNVYQKKVVVPKETPSAPVTIIDKPEKDSKVGLVVTIIITIILGAAAGTVAFLLLPK